MQYLSLKSFVSLVGVSAVVTVRSNRKPFRVPVGFIDRFINEQLPPFDGVDKARWILHTVNGIDNEVRLVHDTGSVSLLFDLVEGQHISTQNWLAFEGFSDKTVRELIVRKLTERALLKVDSVMEKVKTLYIAWKGLDDYPTEIERQFGWVQQIVDEAISQEDL